MEEEEGHGFSSIRAGTFSVINSPEQRFLWAGPAVSMWRSQPHLQNKLREVVENIYPPSTMTPLDVHIGKKILYDQKILDEMRKDYPWQPLPARIIRVKEKTREPKKKQKMVRKHVQRKKGWKKKINV